MSLTENPYKKAEKRFDIYELADKLTRLSARFVRERLPFDSLYTAEN